jgi:hypothetical protein
MIPMLLCYMFCWMLNDELNSIDETMANIIEELKLDLKNKRR